MDIRWQIKARSLGRPHVYNCSANVIVNTETHWGWLLVLLGGMLVMSVSLLIWARRQGWW